ncbi:MAG: dTDP-glucose 4,6-dehydratase [Actinomycetota bacterium]
MRLLVTGGAGFIGSNFIRYMLDKYPDYEIVNLDKLTYAGNLENLRDVEKDPRYSFVKGDICDAKWIDDLAKNVDAIINFAAESHVDRSIEDPQSFVVTDVLGTQNILEAVKNNKVERFLHISTDEVYGSIPEGRSSVETDPIEPNSPYSASKAGGDLLCRAYFETYGTPVMITRSSNNFGPYQYPEKLISLLTTNAIDGLPLTVYGDGLNVRDWIYVMDNCEGLDAVFHKGKIGEVYNIGGGNEKTNLEIVKQIVAETGAPDSLITYVDDRLGHDRRYSLDSTKAKALGWAPRRDFRDAMSETIRWYQENEAWWRPLK